MWMVCASLSSGSILSRPSIRRLAQPVSQSRAYSHLVEEPKLVNEARKHKGNFARCQDVEA